MVRSIKVFRVRSLVHAVVVAVLAAPAAVPTRAQEGEAPVSPKRSAGQRVIPVEPDAGGVALGDVDATLENLRRRGAVRHVRLRKSGRVAALFGDLGTLPRAAAKSETDAAVEFVAGVAPLVGATDAARELRAERRVDGALGEHVTLEQVVGDYPVFHAEAAVHVAPDGRVFGLTSTFEPGIDPSLAWARPTLDEAAAREAALSALSLTPDRVRAGDPFTAQLGVAPVGGGRLAWRVIVPAREPFGQWEVFVDAATGEPLGEPVSLLAAAGRAKVFVPNAVVSTGDISLRDDNNASSAVPEASYATVDLNGLDTSGFVTGTFCSTDRTASRASATGGDFTSLRRGDRGFDEVEAYWAIDTAQRYLQSLGVTRAGNYQIRIDVHAFSDDNSFYAPGGNGQGVLSFGDGGVDDAQDAEIVWHEYGHAVLDNQAQIRLATGESGAIHEGWGDYFAATLSTTVPGDSRFYPTVGEWDATSYNPGNPPFLRRVDGAKRYPRDLNGEVHDDGELWSACLWGIHEALGRATADRIIVNANFLFPFDVTMPDAAAAILQADAQLNGGANASAIRAVFASHGIDAGAAATPAISDVRIRKNKLYVDGADFEIGGAVVEVDGAAYGSLKYPKGFRENGVSRRITSKDSRVRALPAGVAVQVTVLNPGTGLRSAAYSFTP